MFTRCLSSYRRLSTFSPFSSPSLFGCSASAVPTATVSHAKPINNLLHCLINSITKMDFSCIHLAGYCCCCCHYFWLRIFSFFFWLFLSVPNNRESNINSLFSVFIRERVLSPHSLAMARTFQFDFVRRKIQKENYNSMGFFFRVLIGDREEEDVNEKKNTLFFH